MRAVTIRRASYIGILTAAILGVRPLAGQGEATVSTQGFYMGSTGQQSIDATGLALHVQQFIPNIGLLDSKLENYDGNGRWQHGDNYVELRGLVWQDTRWTFRYGNCRVPTSLTAFPFSNFLNPDLTLRGGCMEAHRGHFTYSLFGGTEVLQSGPRIPFWESTPQHIMGASAKYQLGNLEIAGRYIRLNNAVDQLDQNSFLFPLNRRFSQADIFSTKISYRFKEHLRVYAEEDLGRATFVDQDAPTGKHPWSGLYGAAFDSEKLTVRANYSDQGILTLPVVGYFTGDRRGPFADLRFRPIRWLEFFGSAARQSSNLEKDLAVPTLSSESVMAGAAVHLPFQVSASVQLSQLDLKVNTASTGQETSSDNLMTTASLTRPFAHHNLRLTLREMKIKSNGILDVQTSRELEDTMHWRNFVVGGAVRFDTDVSNEHRNTIYSRGNAQINLKKLTAYTYFEIGHDLINQSVFSTSAIRTSVVGLSTRMPGGFDLSAEVFRSNLTTMPNPTNVFLLATQGSAYPGALTGLNQWSAYIRMTRQFTWGKNGGLDDLDRYTLTQIPIVGSVEGFVHAQTRGGIVPANGITVSVDDARFSVTDEAGHYRLINVPEGYHGVRLALDKLPSDLEPGPPRADQYTVVRGGQISREDFLVFPLTGFCGNVEGPPGVALDGIVVRISPSDRYTTPDTDGGFCFYNIREGDYSVQLDASTLPSRVTPLSLATVPFSLKLTPDAQAAPVRFRLGAIVEQRPILKALEDKVIRIAPQQPKPVATVASVVEPVVEPAAPKIDPVNPSATAMVPPTPKPSKSSLRAAAAQREKARSAESRHAAVRKAIEDRLAQIARELSTPVAADFASVTEAPSKKADPISPAPVSAAATMPDAVVAPPAPRPAKPSLRTVEVKQAAELHQSRGRKLTAERKYTQAIAELTLSIELRPDFALAYNARAFAYLKARRPEEALRDLDQAISLRPNYLNAYQNRANAHKVLGDSNGLAEDEAKISELSGGEHELK